MKQLKQAIYDNPKLNRREHWVGGCMWSWVHPSQCDGDDLSDEMNIGPFKAGQIIGDADAAKPIFEGA